MRSANAETVKWTPMTMAFVMMDDCVELDACGVQRSRCGLHVRMFSIPEGDRRMATNSMPWAFVAAVAEDLDADADDVMPVSANRFMCATDPVRFEWDVQTFLKELRLRRQPTGRAWRVRWGLRIDADTDGICDDVDDCVVNSMSAESATTRCDLRMRMCRHS